MRDKLLRFLRNIPQSNEAPKTIGEIAGTLASHEDIRLLTGAAWLLRTLGMVSYDDQSTQIRASAQTAKYALNSFAHYLENDLQVVDDWKTRGIHEEPGRLLDNGASFLHALETRRQRIQASPEPSRIERVAQVLIKRTNPDTCEPELLFQYDENAGRYQLIGGRWRPADGETLATVLREIDEELPACNLTYGEDYELVPLAITLEPDLTISRTFGALTRYQFTLYRMSNLRCELRLKPGDRWIPVTQILVASTSNSLPDEIHIDHELYQLFDRNIDGGIANLPDSYATDT